jgi:hypothetical protein
LGAARAVVFDAALMVSVVVAVACPLTVTVDGLRLHVSRLEEVEQLKATDELKSFSEFRLKLTVFDVPEGTDICGNCGASRKSGVVDSVIW